MDPLQQQVPPVPSSPMTGTPPVESPSSFPPVPPSPVSPGMSPEMPSPQGMAPQPQPELSQQQMKDTLRSKMAQLDAKYQEFAAMKDDYTGKKEENKIKLLRMIFDFFESVGVDPNSVDEVRNYLEKLAAQNPELSAQLNQILEEAVAGDEMPNQGQPVPPEMGAPMEMGQAPTAMGAPQEAQPNMNMNQNENVPQNL